MAYDSLLIARKVLESAWRDNLNITPLQLMKLVFLSHAWSLGLNGKELVDDVIEAWQYGPVVPKVYHAYKGYVDAPITEVAHDEVTIEKLVGELLEEIELNEVPSNEDVRDLVSERIASYRRKSEEMGEVDPESLNVIDAVVKYYGKYTGPQLTELTHEKKGPWDIVYNKYGRGNSRGAVIPSRLIKSHYEKKAQK